MESIRTAVYALFIRLEQIGQRLLMLGLTPLRSLSLIDHLGGLRLSHASTGVGLDCLHH